MPSEQESINERSTYERVENGLGYVFHDFLHLAKVVRIKLGGLRGRRSGCQCLGVTHLHERSVKVHKVVIRLVLAIQVGQDVTLPLAHREQALGLLRAAAGVHPDVVCLLVLAALRQERGRDLLLSGIEFVVELAAWPYDMADVDGYGHDYWGFILLF